MAKSITLQEAVTNVLQKHKGEGMRPKAIWDEIRHSKEWTGKTKTPEASVRYCLGVGLRGDNPQYAKNDAGLYRWNGEYKAKADNAEQPKESKTSGDSRLIRSFGVFWERGKVQWDNKPKLSGVQDDDLRPVNFWKQEGIYILYHLGKLVYVGRTTDGIGIRLKHHHTKGDYKNRWDRFSWFGTRELKDGSNSEFVPSGYKQLTESKMVADLEALLIEIATPWQNGKRGDGMEEIEWKQA